MAYDQQKIKELADRNRAGVLATRIKNEGQRLGLDAAAKILADAAPEEIENLRKYMGEL